MCCDSCSRVLRWEFEQNNIVVHKIKLGEAEIEYNPETNPRSEIEKLISSNGFTLIENRDEVLIDEIKRAVIDLVHHTTYNAMVRNSDFLVGKFGKTYQHLSTLFRSNEGITLEKYIILQRVEKAKMLIHEDELSLSEIAYMMGYSSVQYLSTQFKSISGISVTKFKKEPAKYRKSLDQI